MLAPGAKPLSGDSIMKRTLPLALLACFLAAADAKDDAVAPEVEKALNALNAAFKDGKPDVIKSLMTDDHVAITPYYNGPYGVEELLKTLPELKLSEYRSSDVKVRVLDKDAAIVSYSLAMKGTFKAKPVAAKSYAVSVWVLRKGKWLETSYQETALDK